MYKILIANGVNLDLLGKRPEEHYGQETLEDLQKKLEEEAKIIEDQFKVKLQLSFFQTNQESAYLEKLDEAWSGALLNPGAWTHTSLALADRLEALHLKFVEVHLSQFGKRESVRQLSFFRKHAIGVVYGFGVDSYLLGLHGLIRHLLKEFPI